MRCPSRKSEEKIKPVAIDPVITQDKFDELEKTLNRMNKTRPKLASEVSRLAELGDFSENVEYQIAKGKLRGLNSRIIKTENQIKHSVIIQPRKDNSSVQIGHKVTVVSANGEKTFQILGSTETDPKSGIISRNSPLGKTLINKKVGDIIELQLGEKKTSYKILKIK